MTPGSAQDYSPVELAAMAETAIANRHLIKGIEFAVAAISVFDEYYPTKKMADAASAVVSCSLQLACSAIPPALDRGALTQLQELFGSRRRSARIVGPAGRSLIADAAGHLDGAYRCVIALESVDSCTERALKSVAQLPAAAFSKLVTTWDHVGFLRAVTQPPDRAWALSTRPDDRLLGKCFTCGSRVRGKRVPLLGQVMCPNCKTHREFAILESDPG